MYSVNFILVYLATLLLLSIILINYYRDFIITYRIFAKPKKEIYIKNKHLVHVE